MTKREEVTQSLKKDEKLIASADFYFAKTAFISLRGIILLALIAICAIVAIVSWATKGFLDDTLSFYAVTGYALELLGIFTLVYLITSGASLGIYKNKWCLVASNQRVIGCYGEEFSYEYKKITNVSADGNTLALTVNGEVIEVKNIINIEEVVEAIKKYQQEAQKQAEQEKNKMLSPQMFAFYH